MSEGEKISPVGAGLEKIKDGDAFSHLTIADVAIVGSVVVNVHTAESLHQKNGSELARHIAKVIQQSFHQTSTKPYSRSSLMKAAVMKADE